MMMNRENCDKMLARLNNSLKKKKVSEKIYCPLCKKLFQRRDRYLDHKHNDDDKFGRPTVDFKEKDLFKPNVKLEYIDDGGRLLNAKEAFRYLSHKFHGKGPGKNKIEKRLKKQEQDTLMMKMNSTGTLGKLGTLNMLQLKQKETQSPYIVLRGSKQWLNQN